MEYKKAPNILTNKDLDYLKDMFGWFYSSYKLLYNYTNKMQNESGREMVEEVTNTLEELMHNVIKLGKDGLNG